jgi:hypothetical protein
LDTIPLDTFPELIVEIVIFPSYNGSRETYDLCG